MSVSYSHLHEDYRHLMMLDDEQRIAGLDKRVWIDYPTSDRIMQLLNRLINMPKKHRMQGLLVLGDANMGKTSIVRRFVELHPDTMVEDDMGITRAQRPVIYAEIQNSDEKELYVSVLEGFFAPHRKTDPTIKLKYQMISLMRECNVKMLILDEFHNLLRGTPAKQHIMMDILKTLSNELMIPIVGVGISKAATVLGKDPQLTSRFDIVRLPAWERDKNFRAMLNSLERRLPLKYPSNLSKKDKMPLLYKMCKGNLGDLHRLLIECSIEAIRQGTEIITVDLMSEVKWAMRSNEETAREIPI